MPQIPPVAGADTPPETPGFGKRGSMRRRLRYLHKARELAYRDLGGLVFDLHRFGQRHDELVLAKLTTLGHFDAELRILEHALGERRPATVLREAGIAACPRCAAIHGSDDNFCPSCGLPMGRHADRLIGVPGVQPPTPIPTSPAPSVQPASSAQSAAPTATPTAATAPASGVAPAAATPATSPLTAVPPIAPAAQAATRPEGQPTIAFPAVRPSPSPAPDQATPDDKPASA